MQLVIVDYELFFLISSLAMVLTMLLNYLLKYKANFFEALYKLFILLHALASIIFIVSWLYLKLNLPVPDNNEFEYYNALNNRFNEVFYVKLFCLGILPLFTMLFLRRFKVLMVFMCLVLTLTATYFEIYLSSNREYLPTRFQIDISAFYYLGLFAIIYAFIIHLIVWIQQKMKRS